MIRCARGWIIGSALCAALMGASLGKWDGDAAAESSLPSLAKKLDSAVWHVSTGGLWESGDKYGKCRIVVLGGGVEHVSTYVYAQWLRVDESQKGLVECETKEVAQLNSGFKNVQSVRYDSEFKGAGCRFVVMIQPDRAQPEAVRVVLKEVGVVEVEKTR
jgi:hypothetical protein